MSAVTESPTMWFPGGPLLGCLPMPIPDADQPWGNTSCSKCKDKTCCGHFLKPDVAVKSMLVQIKPPSQTLKEAFSKLKGK